MRTQDILRREKMELTLDKLLNLFIAIEQIEERSAFTLEWYKKRLGEVIAYLGDGRIPDLSLNNARSFVVHRWGHPNLT